MKALLMPISRQLVLLTVLTNYVSFSSALTSLIDVKENPATSNNNNNKPSQISCPPCGIRSSDSMPGTSTLECERFYTKTQIKLDDYNRIPLPSFKCKCNYTRIHKNDCGTSRQNENSFPVSGECLVAHVGMAVRGHNLLHRKWVDKESCFNLCLRTRIKNGHSFDCRSFEHWHRDCDSEGNGDRQQSGKMCASFELDGQEKSVGKQRNTENNYLQHKYPFSDEYYKRQRLKNSKRAYKTDICVLSNQTIDLSPDNFLPNQAVTYYEVLCVDERPRNRVMTSEKPSQQASSLNDINASQKDTSSSVESINKYPMESQEETQLQSEEDVSQATKTTQTTATNDLSGKQCKFNPCQNGGACILIDTHRFTCLCKDLFYGIYCDSLGIQKICHKTFMEIIVDHKVADNLNIQASDLFVNRKNSQEACQLYQLNATHSRFTIQYDKCSTISSNISGEIIYTNKLFSRVKVYGITEGPNQFKNNYLTTMECRISTDISTAKPKSEPLYHSSIAVNNQPKPDQFSFTTKPVVSFFTPITPSKETDAELETHRANEKVTDTNCIIDLFQLRMRLFMDSKYQQEYVKSKRNKIAYGERMYAQFHVEPTERLNELYRIQEHLQYMHLTLLNCWLTSTSNPFLEIKQILVADGCPKKGVSFFDAANLKNSIQFGFAIMESSSTDAEKRISQYHLHCDPEICIDQSIESAKDKNFFGHYKSCKNITTMCDAKKQLDEYAIKTPSDLKNEIKNYNPENSQCNSLLIEGPLYTGKSVKSGQVNSSALSVFNYQDMQKCIIILFINVCIRLLE